jgi:hypothetical protein
VYGSEISNFEEGFADAFAAYFTDQSDLKRRYPQQYEYLRKTIASKGSKIKNMVKQIVTQVENYK